MKKVKEPKMSILKNLSQMKRSNKSLNLKKNQRNLQNARKSWKRKRRRESQDAEDNNNRLPKKFEPVSEQFQTQSIEFEILSTLWMNSSMIKTEKDPEEALFKRSRGKIETEVS